MHSLAGNRALVDGDKRLALLATVMFLRINGYMLDLADDEAFHLTMSAPQESWMLKVYLRATPARGSSGLTACAP